MLPSRVVLLGICLLMLGLQASTASAATEVSGRLDGKSVSSYTVLGLSPNGGAVRGVVKRDGRFKLSFPKGASRGATLQLVEKSGSYFGPVTLAKARNRRVPVGLSGRAVKLGKIKLRSGWAATVADAPPSALDGKRTARADKAGKPLGAGRLGLVASAASGRAAQGGDSTSRGGADPDADGIPTALDVDSNGNGRLDQTDPDAAPSSAGLFSSLFANLGETPGSESADIDGFLRDHLGMVFYLDDRAIGSTVSAVNVDCFELVYCRRGTGTALASGLSEGSGDLVPGPWRDYDPDGDGLPNIPALRSNDGRPVHGVSIQPRVGRADIHPGDIFDIRHTTPGGVVSRPTVLSGYFVSLPTIASINGNAVSYPVSNSSPGTDANPLQLDSDQVALVFSRPQRPSIPGAEPEGRREIGGLNYGIPLETANRQLECRAEHVDASPTLRPASGGSDDFSTQLWPLVDTASDGAPGARGPLSFTLEIGNCMRRNGMEPAGQTLRLSLTAAGQPKQGGSDRASQTFAVRLPG